VLTEVRSSQRADEAMPTSVGHPVVGTVADRGRTQAFPICECLNPTAQECPAHLTRGRTKRELSPLRAGKMRMEEAKG